MHESASKRLREQVGLWVESPGAKELAWWPALEKMPELAAAIEARDEPAARQVLAYLDSPLDLHPELVFGVDGYRDDLYLMCRYIKSLPDAPAEAARVANDFLEQAGEVVEEELRAALDELLERILAREDEAEPDGVPAPADGPAVDSDKPEDAVSHLDGPMIVFAGPGSGKTWVIEHRVAKLIDGHGVEPEHILVVTFTNMATDELVVRLHKALSHRRDGDELLARMRVGTIHSFCYSLVREHQHRVLFLRGTFLPATEQNQILFLFRKQWQIGLDRLYDDWRKDRKERGEPSYRLSRYHFLDEAAGIFNFVSEEVLGAGHERRIAYQRVLLGEGDDVDAHIVRRYPRYWRAMIDDGLMDNSMILSYAEALLECPEVLAALRRQHRYILVDEYQDTNPIQDRIFREIAGEGGNLFVVGDDDQAIYRFRGADVGNITGFTDRVRSAGRVRLNANRRSSHALVRATSTLIAGNRERVPKDLVALPEIEEGRRPVMVRCGSVEEQAAWATERIGQLKQSGEIGRWDQCAILFRSVRKHGKTFAKALAAKDIPVRIASDRGLFKTGVVSGLYQALQMMDRKPKKPRVKAARPRNIKRFFEPLGIKYERSLELVASRADRLETGDHKSLLLMLYDILDETRALAELADDFESLTNLGTLAELVADFEERERGRTLQDRFNHLLNYFEAINDQVDQGVADLPDAVELMTVHKSKGLQFDHVFMADLSAHAFPMAFQPGPRDRLGAAFEGVQDPAGAQLEEERRVLYVGMTRAAIGLYLLVDEKAPSPFLDGLEPLCDDAPGSAAGRPPRSVASGERPMRATHSALYDYRYCPMRYRLTQVHGFPGAVIQPVLEGLSMHRALEIFHRLLLEGRKPAADDLERIFDRAWIVTDENRKKPEQKEEVAAAFERYALGVLAQKGFRVVAVEQPFMASQGNDILIGKIDLLARQDDALEVVEFKYRSNKQTEDYTQHQLDHYRLAFPGLEVQPVLYYLREGGAAPKECKDCEEVWEGVHKTFARIRERAFDPRPSRKQCNPCPVRQVCVYKPARKGAKG